jgi:hypothetical protein
VIQCIAMGDVRLSLLKDLNNAHGSNLFQLNMKSAPRVGAGQRRFSDFSDNFIHFIICSNFNLNM